jgi:teichuronic acid biosynthesis glycosyltransferase TuaH
MKEKLDHDIIMLALARWDGPYSSTAYSLAKALSLHTRVFYIDNPITAKCYLAKRNTPEIKKRKNALLKGKDFFFKPDQEHYPNMVAITPRLTVPVNWLPSGGLYDTLAKVNDNIVSIVINQTIREYGIKKYIFINSFNPFFGRFFKLSLKPFLKIYQNVDDISQSPYLYKHGVRLEIEAMKEADFTITTSSQLKRRSAVYTENAFLLPNAANVKLFQRAAKEDLQLPDEIKALPEGKKIICYAGNICHRLDYELLIKIAQHHHDKILLMIGPFANKIHKEVGLHHFPNIVFTGKKKLEELPAYLKHSDCCIIPFLCNQLTKSIYPLKINEYLSAGKPVISTNFSDDILTFKSMIYSSDTHEEFLTNIDKAIQENSPEFMHRRVAASAPNDWENRAIQLIDLVDKFLMTKRKDFAQGVRLTVGVETSQHLA